jgi:serine protease AprX
VRKVTLLLLALLLVCSFTISWRNISPEGSLMHNGAQEPHETSETSARLHLSPTDNAPKSMIRVSDGQNKTVTVILESQTSLTYVTTGLSTIINPPPEIADKIDANLLNLTELVTRGYIEDNQTNIIMALSSQAFLDERSCLFTPEDLVKDIQKLYTSTHACYNMHFLSAKIPYSAVFDLARTTQVNHIWLDRRFQACLDQSVKLIKDPIEWARIESSFNRAINGSGKNIAILDTGIDQTHPDFSFPNGTSKIVEAISFTGESTGDGFGHGTHCASIAAGTGVASSGQYVGVAPGAALLNVKVLNNQGEGLESWVISGIQWAVDHDANVLSMSFGESVSGDGTDPLSTTVNWAAQQGVVCVAAAGNSGPQMYTLTSPGVAELAITVGASSKSDLIASFSSRGPTSDYRVKPDVVAPGIDIVAARANDTSMGTPVSQYYTKASGTSMATPHVAGAAALLLDAHPSWSPAKIKMTLTNCAQDTNSNVFDQGSGRLNVCKAVNASIIGNSSIGFGRVDLDVIYKRTVVFQNLGIGSIGVTLNAETWHINDGTLYYVASLNTSSLILSYGATGNVEISLNTSVTLPSGYYGGRIAAIAGDARIRIPFFFCIVSQLNVEVTDEKGSTLMAAFALIDAETGATKAYTESEHAQFIMPEGNYIIQAMNVYAWNPSDGLDAKTSFIIHKKFSANIGETINIQLSLASAYKLTVRSTDTMGSPIYLILKQLLTPYYSFGYLSEIGALTSQCVYLTNISEYMKSPCFFGFAGFPQAYSQWTETGTLTSEVDAYFIGWDLSRFGLSPIPSSLSYENSELATFNIENVLPKSSPISTMWFNQISGMWQSGFWYGYETYPGSRWVAHVLPFQYKASPSQNYSDLEWSCIYASSNYPQQSAESYVIDRHFEPITKGENLSYTMGKTPLSPQEVLTNPPYCGNGVYIPYYPLRGDRNLYLAKTDMRATKRLEVFRNGYLIANETKNWAQAPISISQFLNSHGYGLYSFIVKTETNLDYSLHNIANYTINYASTNSDLLPPSITRIDCDPCFIGNEHQVQVQLADRDMTCNVTLFYATDNGPYVPAVLRDLGNNTFSANVTFTTSVQEMSLFIEARDANGNGICFSTNPVALRGYETSVDAALNEDEIAGRLTVTGGALMEPVYLKIRSPATIMYTLADIDGNFHFSVPEALSFPIKIEMRNMGPYYGSVRIIEEPQIHDVAATELVTSKTIASGNVYINVTALNKGTSNETFQITAYANSTPVQTQTVTLPGKKSTTITFVWGTSNLAKGNYAISAYAWPVAGENETDDNRCVGSWVIVSIPGDTDGDFDVDIFDATRLLACYGLKEGEQGFNPNCDIDDDGRIFLYDAVVVCHHYGQKQP